MNKQKKESEWPFVAGLVGIILMFLFASFGIGYYFGYQTPSYEIRPELGWLEKEQTYKRDKEYFDFTDQCRKQAKEQLKTDTVAINVTRSPSGGYNCYAIEGVSVDFHTE